MKLGKLQFSLDYDFQKGEVTYEACQCTVLHQWRRPDLLRDRHNATSKLFVCKNTRNNTNMFGKTTALSRCQTLCSSKVN